MSGTLWFLAVPKRCMITGTHCTLTEHRGVTPHDADVFFDAMSASVLRHRKVVSRRRQSLDIRVTDQVGMFGVNQNKPGRLVELRNLSPMICAAEKLLPRYRFGGDKVRQVPHITEVDGIRVDAQVWRDVDLAVQYRGEWLILPRLPSNW